MKSSVRNVVWSVLLLLLLASIAVAVPAARVTDEAEAGYQELTQDGDDEFDFLQG